MKLIRESVKQSVKIEKIVNIIKKVYVEKYCRPIWDQKGDLYHNYDNTLTFDRFVSNNLKLMYVAPDDESTYDINLEVLRPDKIIENDFINFLKKINFNNYGWQLTMAFKTNILSVFRLRVEKLHGEKINTGRYIYHITFDYYMDKINKMGIIPLSNAKLANHPKRIYCLLNPKWKFLAQQLFEYEKNGKFIDTAILLQIDTQKLKHGVKFYYDPDCGFEGGIYTYSIIPKNAFKIYDHILL